MRGTLLRAGITTRLKLTAAARSRLHMDQGSVSGCLSLGPGHSHNPESTRSYEGRTV